MTRPDESLIEFAEALRIEGYVLAVGAFVSGGAIGALVTWVVLR